MFARAVAVIGAAIMLAVAPGASAQTAPVELRIGMNAPNTGHWSLFIAEREGFFRDAGLHVTRLVADGPSATIALLVTKNVDVIAGSTDDVIASIVHGAPVKIFAPGFRTNPFSLMTVPSITSWQQLKGKTVVTGPRLNEGGFSFDVMARANGYSPSDFTLTVVTNSNLRYAALASGSVGGSILTQPFDVVAQRQGMHVLSVADAYMRPWMYSMWAAQPAWLAAHRSTAVAFIRAIRRANAFAYAHPDAAIAALTDNMHVDAATAKAVYDLDFRRWHAFDPEERLDADALQAVTTRALQAGSIDALPPLGTLYDASYAEAAAR